MEHLLSEKTTVVVGEKLGHGRALALRRAETGAAIFKTFRSVNGVELVASEIEQRARRTLCITSDVADRSTVKRARDARLGECSTVDILLTSAVLLDIFLTFEYTEGMCASMMDIIW